MLYTAEHNTRRSEQRIDSPRFRQRHGGKPAATETQKATERAGTDHNRARAAKKWCAKRRIKAQAQGVEGNFAHGKGFRARSCMQAMVGVAQDARMQPMPRKFRYIEFIAYEVPVTISGDWMILTDGEWCPREESNLHALRHTVLSRACLPFHHSG